MAEDKTKKPDELQEEQLDEVNGGTGLPPYKRIWGGYNWSIMAEDKNKLKDEEQLNEEQLDKVAGGFTIKLTGLKDSEIKENAEWRAASGRATRRSSWWRGSI